MAFAPTVDLLTNSTHSLLPHEFYHSNLTVNPTLSPNINSNEYQPLTQTSSIMSDSHIDQITGT
jgi:hypothetical protein